MQTKDTQGENLQALEAVDEGCVAVELEGGGTVEVEETTTVDDDTTVDVERADDDDMTLALLDAVLGGSVEEDEMIVELVDTTTDVAELLEFETT